MIVLSCLFTLNCLADTTVKIKGSQAKLVFDSLTGDRVSTDITKRMIHRQGESVDCWVLPKDVLNSKAYACAIHFDENGQGSPRD